jgi:uncharacterized membrane protein YagU involved in acid resistance
MQGEVPVAGSLSAVVIRACKVHIPPRTCELDCPERKVENLGEIASFKQGEKKS